MKRPTHWDSEILYSSGDDYFAGLLAAIDGASFSIELETYIFEKGVLADRMVAHLTLAVSRGVQVRMIVDGWGSPNFLQDYYGRLRSAGIRVHFFRVIPWILKRLPGDPRSFTQRLLHRWRTVNRGNHRKFCLIDHSELWVGSFNISDVHLREVQGDRVWKDAGVCVRGVELKYARRAFQRAFRGWTALNWPARSPRLLLLNDSLLHKRRTRLEHLYRLRQARERVWLATPYFVPVGKLYRLLSKSARSGVDVRLIVPLINDVWFMKWMSLPLLRALSRQGVQVYIYGQRFAHQKLFIADDWIALGSTNLNHRSFLHDLEMDVVITKPENKLQLVSGYIKDLELSQPFDSSALAQIPLWKRVLSSVFLLAKYWS